LRIDDEVEKIVSKAYDTCRTLLTDNRALLDQVAATLIKEETIGNDTLLDLVREAGVLPQGKGAKFEEIKKMLEKGEKPAPVLAASHLSTLDALMASNVQHHISQHSTRCWQNRSTLHGLVNANLRP
jgi:hypothetical protein